MPLSESMLQTMGGLTLPAVEDSDNDTLASLDPARDQLLAFFAAAINSELGAAWTAVTDTLGASHRLYGTSPVQDTLPDEPTEQFLTQRKTGFPLLALHRVGTGQYQRLTLELTRLVQPWKLYYILGPLDIIDVRKLKDVCVAVGKIVALATHTRKHKAYDDEALQFFDLFTSVRVVSHEGPGQAAYAGDSSTTIFWAIEINLETVERSGYVEGSEGSDAEALDVIAGVGGDEGIQPELVLGSSDAEPSA
jgi:hypothetical protein